MRLLRYALKSINLLNLLLVAATVFLGAHLFPAVNSKVTYRPPAVKEMAQPHEESPVTGQSPPPADYVVVGEQNVFHPERRIPPETKDEKDKPKPEIILYGTLLADGLRLAYLEDRKSPQSTPGRGPRQSVVKQGDTVSGYLLKSVETDRIVLVRGQEQIIAFLNDPLKRPTGVAEASGAQPDKKTPPPPQSGPAWLR